MSLDDDIKQAFARHEDDATPVGLDDVTETVTAANRRWAARTMLLTVALIAFGVAGALELVRDADRPGPSPSNLANPDVSTTPTPTAESTTFTFRDELEGWQVVAPKEWPTSMFEGHIEFRPTEDLPGLSVGDPTFAVEIWLNIGTDLATSESDSGQTDWGNATLAGRDARVRTASGEPSTITYLVEWSGIACTPSACPDASPATLHLTVFASTEELWESHGSAGEEIVKSLGNSADSVPTGPVRTRWGTIGSDILYDDATQVISALLDARLAGDGAEIWLTANAKREYGRELYRPSPDPERTWLPTQWKVLARADNADGSVQFFADVYVESDGETAQARELITVAETDAGLRIIHYESASEGS